LISEDWRDFDFTHSVMKVNMPKKEIEETLEKAYKEYYLKSNLVDQKFYKSGSRREEVVRTLTAKMCDLVRNQIPQNSLGVISP